MDGAVITMVVARPIEMFQFVCDVEPFARREPYPLRGKTLQRQKYQQKDADEAAHWKLENKFCRIIATQQLSRLPASLCRSGTTTIGQISV